MFYLYTFWKHTTSGFHMFLGVIDVEHWPEMSEGFNSIHICKYIVGNKAERWISNGCYKKTKHAKLSEKRTFLAL